MRIVLNYKGWRKTVDMDSNYAMSGAVRVVLEPIDDFPVLCDSNAKVTKQSIRVAWFVCRDARISNMSEFKYEG